jgi:hypothetical protein
MPGFAHASHGMVARIIRKTRLKRLEESFAAAGCPGCTDGVVTVHQEYLLPNGETLTLPPFPPPVPCTCGGAARKPTQVQVVAVVIKHPGVVESREAAERCYAAYAAFHRPWQPNVE